MGKKNRERRAAKAKKRAERTGGTGSGARWGWGGAPGRGPSSEQERVEGLLGLNLMARQVGDTTLVEQTVEGLARCSPVEVGQWIERDLGRVLAALWGGGWLPGEVVRQARRTTSAASERLAAAAVAADHLGREPATLHPRWRQHVDELGLPSGVRPGWLRSFRPTERAGAAGDWPAVIDLATATVAALGLLGPQVEIVPPPSAANARRSVIDLTSRVADPMLARVRQLLAQAESTSFDAEAEAFTAKAQELMARHAIDAALVWDRRPDDAPTTIRVPLDDPYMDAKSILLTVVANESHSRAVIDTRYGLASVVGFEGDLVWCETLYTSLLVQAQREMARAGATDQAGGRRRSRSFRSSFLLAYAHRIGERLAEVNAAVQNQSIGDETAAGGSAGPALLPVLARRRSAVDDAVDSHFGELVSGPSRGATDYLGWNAGHQAADRARLTQGELDAKQAS